MSPLRRRRGLVAVWVLLAILVVAITMIEYADRRRPAAGSAGEADTRLLLPVPVDELGAVEIADRGRLHRFERDAAGAWFYHGEHSGNVAGDHTHPTDPAAADRIARAFAAFGRARIERRFRLEGAGGAYGVASPEVLILVYRRDGAQPAAQLAVGHVAPDTVSRYVMLVGKPEVFTIPKYQIDNLLALIGPSSESARR